jgi:hypothetical protein
MQPGICHLLALPVLADKNKATAWSDWSADHDVSPSPVLCALWRAYTLKVGTLDATCNRI